MNSKARSIPYLAKDNRYHILFEIIWNLALVEKAEIDFGSGFNVITGETGAGKSVIMGAISLLLGERAGKNVLRTGTDKCEIAAGINLGGQVKKLVAEILEDTAIENAEDDQLLLKRRKSL